MPSRGSPTLQIRLSYLFIEQIKATILRLNKNREGKPLNMSGFLFTCIDARLKELDRQGRYRKEKSAKKKAELLKVQADRPQP